MKEETLRTPLARVRGLGSAKIGTHHWWLQRVTAVALVPLTLWFTVSLTVLGGADWPQVKAWFQNPLAALGMILFIVVMFWHFKLGLQVVIEDYVHRKSAKLILLILNTFGSVVFSGIAILSIFKLWIGS